MGYQDEKCSSLILVVFAGIEDRLKNPLRLLSADQRPAILVCQCLLYLYCQIT